MVVGVAVLWLFTPWSLVALLSAAVWDSVAVVAVLSRVPEAITLVREERERTAAEHDAFETFARRVATLEEDHSQPPQATPGQAGNLVHSTPGTGPDRPTEASSASIEQVREMYRETVMAVPHYEEEYDEPLEEHMAQEFGTELVIALSQSQTLTPQLHKGLVSASIQARDERTDLLQQLENEHQSLKGASVSLESVHDAIRTVEESLARRTDRELADAWERLEELEDDCRTLLRERQSNLDDAREMSLQEYLYATQPWAYPVLCDDLDTIDRVQQAKQRVVETILSRG